MDSPGQPTGRTLSVSVHSSSSKTADALSSAYSDSALSHDKLSAAARAAGEGGCPAPESRPNPSSKRLARLRSATVIRHKRQIPSPTDHFREWIDAFMPSAGKEALHVYHSVANQVPPISEESLKELEVSSIVCNARLRHDINFDRELHFRPNFDGDKGKDKARQAALYWQALEVELEFCQYMLAASEQFRQDARLAVRLHEGLKRLPRMFATVKEVLISLMPEDDLCRVDEVLDVKLVMQAIEKGVFDLPRLATWLAALLKAHCAPMRDSWVDRMERHLCSAPDEGQSDARHIVNGMKELFGILEAMKLDVANHQIRYLRPVLVANTFAFERHYFQRRIAEGRFDMQAIREWYSAATAGCTEAVRQAGSERDLDSQRFAAFTQAWLRNLAPAANAGSTAARPMPGTFKLDVERVLGLQADVRNLLYKHICCIAHRTIAAYIEPGQPIADATDNMVMERVSVLVGRDATEARWRAQIGNIAVELTRIASTCLEQQRSKIEGSFGVISEALEGWLKKNLQVGTVPFQQAADGLMGNIVQRTVEASREVLRLTPNEIFDALAPPMPANVPVEVQQYYAQSGRSRFRQDAGASDSLMEIVRRASQISVLHWRVWGPLLFEEHVQQEQDELCTKSTPSRSSSTGSLDNRMRRFSIHTWSPRHTNDEGYGSS